MAHPRAAQHTSSVPVLYVSVFPSLAPKGVFASPSLASLHETLMTFVLALLKYGKGKERERTLSNGLGSGILAQDRDAGAGHSTLSGQNSASKSFGRASGRKVKASASGTSSMPASLSNSPSTSSRLLPGPRHGTQLSPPQNSRTSADTITYGPLPYMPLLFLPCLTRW